MLIKLLVEPSDVELYSELVDDPISEYNAVISSADKVASSSSSSSSSSNKLHAFGPMLLFRPKTGRVADCRIFLGLIDALGFLGTMQPEPDILGSLDHRLNAGGGGGTHNASSLFQRLNVWGGGTENASSSLFHRLSPSAGVGGGFGFSTSVQL